MRHGSWTLDGTTRSRRPKSSTSFTNASLPGHKHLLGLLQMPPLVNGYDESPEVGRRSCAILFLDRVYRALEGRAYHDFLLS